MECRKQENSKRCNCGFECERKGVCCLCVEYHRNKKQLPACYFSDKIAASHDRSAETYFKELKQ